ncbi:trigger factor [Enterobacteriaceae endosymbiont of Neohaemonia nigricornis]|uniref:trigger factor n=1 Tax=Enterobacteriaceae endosymbiont of Neohaemonia nigricornis TaxID=2675792 RepID=UPI001ABEF94D|nr:trigger factor [Enterobacteriaceae endosymbiont of Neohaemonia nigricornis]
MNFIPIYSKEMNMTIISKIIMDHIQKELLIISQNKNIKGFRKGKAPLSLITKLFVKDTYKKVLYKLMNDMFYKFIYEKKINIIGQPKFYYKLYKYGYNLTFNVCYYQCHEFDIQQLNNMVIEIPDINIQEQDIKNIIKQNYIKNITWLISSNNYVISINDRVTIDIYLNNKNNLVLKNKKIVLDKENYIIQDLEIALINKKHNEEFYLNKIVLNNYPNKNILNTKQNFIIHIKKIEIKKEVYISKDIYNVNNHFTYKILYNNTIKQLELIKKKIIRNAILHNFIKIFLKNFNNITISNNTLIQLKLHKEYNEYCILTNILYQKLLLKNIKEYIIFKIFINQIIIKMNIKSNMNLILDMITEEITYVNYINHNINKKYINNIFKNKYLLQLISIHTLEYQIINNIIKNMKIKKIKFNFSNI